MFARPNNRNPILIRDLIFKDKKDENPPTAFREDRRATASLTLRLKRERIRNSVSTLHDCIWVKDGYEINLRIYEIGHYILWLRIPASPAHYPPAYGGHVRGWGNRAQNKPKQEHCHLAVFDRPQRPTGSECQESLISDVGDRPTHTPSFDDTEILRPFEPFTISRSATVDLAL